MRIGLALLALMLSALALAENSSLTVQVKPEAYLAPASIPLSFSVDTPGQTVSSRPVTVTAWVRSLPNQQIQVTAQASGLTGPAGSAPIAALGFDGNMASATGGAKTSRCTSGAFSASPEQPLIAGWNQSGIATCAVSFSLNTGAAWPAGIYTAQASLKLLIQ